MNSNSQSVHPSELVQEEWRVSRRTIAGGLVVEHGLAAPGEASAPALTHHSLLVQLSNGSNTRQVTRLGKEEYDGPNPAGAFMLAVANDTPSFWAWNSTNEVMMFAIDPLRLQTLAVESGSKARELDLKPVTFGMDGQFELLARQYHAEFQHEGLGDRLYSESLGNLLLLHLLRNYSHQPPQFCKYDKGLGNKRLKQVVAYIEAHLEQNIGLGNLATVAGLSQCHFSRMFKQSLGMPPYRYVLLQRIERAKYWLRKSDRPINEVALQCGFADQSHLTKHFRKSVGMTPRAFREF